MSRARHKAQGGATPSNEKPKVYAGEAGNVDNEAEERKRGGRAKRKHGGKVEGDKAPMNLGRAARKRGGRTGGGSNRSPLTSAANSSNPEGHTPDMSGDASDGERP